MALVGSLRGRRLSDLHCKNAYLRPTSLAHRNCQTYLADDAFIHVMQCRYHEPVISVDIRCFFSYSVQVFQACRFKLWTYLCCSLASTIRRTTNTAVDLIAIRNALIFQQMTSAHVVKAILFFFLSASHEGEFTSLVLVPKYFGFLWLSGIAMALKDF